MLAYELAKKLKTSPNVYCSHGCVAKALKGEGHPCLHCGKPTGSTDRKRRYCSKECRAAVRPVKTKDCPQCGATFQYSSERRAFCSRTCADAAHSTRMVGTGNSRFKTGTSYALWFRRMRPLIRERDEALCRACLQPDQPYQVKRAGKISMRSSLVVHHINEKPWDNRPQNLILLCKTCHGVHHKSATTPYPWFGSYAADATRSMTSKWKATVTSLQKKFSSTTA